MSGCQTIRWWGLFLALLGVSFAVPFLMGRRSDDADQKFSGKLFRRELGEDVKLSRHGLYGVNLVECGKCSIEKLKRGPFTFGGFNVLVLEDLKIVLQPVSNRVDAAEGSGGKRKAESVQEILDGLGVNETVWVGQGIGKRFSGLRIKGLEVSRYEDNKVVGLFRARQGEAKSDGLHLTGCDIISQSNRRVPHAVLKLNPMLQLVWPGGKLDLRR